MAVPLSGKIILWLVLLHLFCFLAATGDEISSAFDVTGDSPPVIGKNAPLFPRLASSGENFLVINKTAEGRLYVTLRLAASEAMKVPQAVPSEITFQDSLLSIKARGESEINARKDDIEERLPELPDRFFMKAIIEADTALWLVQDVGDSIHVEPLSVSENIKVRIGHPWPGKSVAFIISEAEPKLVQNILRQCPAELEFLVLEEGYYFGDNNYIARHKGFIGVRSQRRAIEYNLVGGDKGPALLVFRSRGDLSPNIQSLEQMTLNLSRAGLERGRDYMVMNR